MDCVRCGSDNKLETDRIIPGIEGGKYVPENTRELCQGCHKYRHERDKIVANLEGESQPDRVAVLRERLRILDEQNEPEKVKQRGYYSYWNDYPVILPRKQTGAGIYPPKEQMSFELLAKER
ncbi:hypothetical protein ES707_04886 [subsurface metagenome]